ncbi:MAG: general secretion pathway protein GspB [Candidatus Thiodiazotropha sp. L084R]
MSLILEALKKAERQHKLGEVPGISAQASEQNGQGKQRLGWGVLSIFALAMLGVGLYLGSMQDTPPPQTQAQSEPEITPPAGELMARPVRPAATDPQPISEARLTPQAAQPMPVEEKPKPIEQVEVNVAPVTPPPVRPAPVQAPPEPPPPRARPLHKMPSGFVSNLPVMNIDIHSYDPRPPKRYVLINMEKYREGDYLAEGPNLIEILPQGVVMEHMGERFILPLGNL